MLTRSWKCSAGTAVQVLWNLGLITLGSVLCAMGIKGILIPNQFFAAGFTGVALVVHYLVPSLPVAVLYFILNIPLYGLGWIHVGRRFFLYSIAGMLIFSGALAWNYVPLPVYDKIPSAVLAGIITGVGSGIILRSLGSAGGLDILSIILLKQFSIRLGTTILAFNSLVLAAGAILFSLERALYTLIYLYVNSLMINLVVTGLSQRKAVYIISPVVTFRELARLKRMISGIDSNAFVVVTDTLEVMGQRIGNQPQW